MLRITLLRGIKVFLLALVALSAGAQNSFQEKYKFLIHLNKLGAYQEGVYYIDQQVDFHRGTESDTLQFLKGYFQYQQKDLDASISSFSKVRSESQLIFIQSQFWLAFQRAYQKQYNEAMELESVRLDSSAFYSELQSSQLAAVSLLQRDFSSFDKYESNFTGDFYQLKSTQEKLRLNKEGLLKVERKSPFVAGLLSAAIPGAGKFYVGKAGEGYLTLLISTILGLQMREAYKKDGLESTRFKIYGGLFSAIYIANIWGSVMSVKIYRNEINQTYDEAILLNMHVPLRTIFD